MPRVRTWFPDDGVTQCNTWGRLYFSPGCSRLMLDDGFVDFSNLRDRAYAMAWCQANGVGFFDHRPELLPECLRHRILKARASGSGELRELKSQWRLAPLGPSVKMFMPQLSHIPSWREVQSARSASPRFWNRTTLHAHTCPCFDCLRSRSERAALSDTTR